MKKKMQKVIYKLEYKDFVGRSCVREYKASCIVTVMNDAKEFAYVNHVQVAKVVTPSGKEYYIV